MSGSGISIFEEKEKKTKEIFHIILVKKGITMYILPFERVSV